jgi:hypothetical protein
MLRARTLANPGGLGEGVVGPFCDRAACPDNAASRWYSHFQENTTAAGEGSRLLDETRPSNALMKRWATSAPRGDDS